MPDTPSISVAIVAYNASATIGRCLAALRAQTDQEFEVLLVDSSTDNTAQLATAAFPRIRIVRSQTRLYPGAARNAAVSACRSDVIAFVDSDCVAAADWVATIRRQHAASGAGAIGGSVVPANPESLTGWGAYFTEFSTWMQAGEVRTMPDIPTCNISYKRDALMRHGPFRAMGYCSDTALNWKLTQAGDPPLFVPQLTVAHFNLTQARRYVAKQWMHGENFARMRCGERGWNAAQRAAFAVGCTVLPAVLLARVARRAWRAGATGMLLKSLPVVVVGLTTWSGGEARGYVRGA